VVRYGERRSLRRRLDLRPTDRWLKIIVFAVMSVSSGVENDKVHGAIGDGQRVVCVEAVADAKRLTRIADFSRQLAPVDGLLRCCDSGRFCQS